VTLLRRLGDVIVQQEVVVHVPSSLPEVTRSVKTEIGVGDRLRLELECNKWKCVCMCLRVTRNALQSRFVLDENLFCASSKDTRTLATANRSCVSIHVTKFFASAGAWSTL